jgi:UDP-glucuronate 4-epimerase
VKVLVTGDLPGSSADVEALARDVGYRPQTDMETGVERFVEWYLGHYHPQS